MQSVAVEKLTKEMASEFLELYTKQAFDEEPYIKASKVINSLLYDWIYASDMRKEEMKIFADVMKKVFVFRGELYRGVAIKDTQTVQDVEKRALECLASSFTDIIEVAQFYAGIDNKEYEPTDNILDGIKNKCLIVAFVNDAFALDDFLVEYQEICTDKKLVNLIDDFLWENEKIVMLSQGQYLIKYH